MNKKHFFFGFVLIAVFCLTLGVASFLFSDTTKTPVQTPGQIPGLVTFRIIQPTESTIWFTGKKYEIQYEIFNMNKPHWVRLLKGGQVLGNFAGGNDMGNTIIKLGITCGGPLLNGVKYGPGNDYQVEIATNDEKIKVQSKTFKIYKTIEPVPLPKEDKKAS